jgi:glycerol-3-phosphate dehydrogenase
VVPEVLSSYALLIAIPRDNRVIFVIPWRGASLVGTTDLDDGQDPDRVHPTAEETDYLLREASRIFPGKTWTREAVIAAFAGLRPLAWSPEGNASSVSREDRILSDGNLFSIVGGKLTTYHSMAHKALDKILKRLGRRTSPNRPDRLPGTPLKPWKEFLEDAVASWTVRYRIDAVQAEHLARLYGQKAPEVLSLASDEPRWGERLHPERPELAAQVVHAVRSERALHLEDLLLRRLELGYGPQRWGPASAKASRIMAGLLGWDEETRFQELERYRRLLYPAVPPETGPGLV